MISFLITEIGRVQVGLRFTSVMRVSTTGVCLSVLPTTATKRRVTAPFSTASTVADGMLTAT